MEEAVIVQEEELVEDLGDVELSWESRIEENSVQDATVDAKEDTIQSPRQVVYEESDGIIQEANSLDGDIHKSSSLGDENLRPQVNSLRSKNLPQVNMKMMRRWISLNLQSMT